MFVKPKSMHIILIYIQKYKFHQYLLNTSYTVKQQVSEM